MWNNLFDYWKGLTCLGALTLPFAGWFFLNAKSLSIEWNNPLGYYTKLKLFIRRKGVAGQAASALGAGNVDQRYKLLQVSQETVSSAPSNGDLVAEYPLTTLDKESYWRYCLPKNSQLQKPTTTVTAATAESSAEECKMQWKSSAPEIINYLLKLGMDFFKLQHQMNLFMIFHLKDKITDDNEEIKKQIQQTCELQETSDKKHHLKDFFTSNAPISKKCLLTPREIELTLETDNSSQQVQSSSAQQEIQVDELKKGKIWGSIKYSLSGYYGDLHKFDWKNVVKNGDSGDTKHEILIELKGKTFELGLENSGTVSSGTSNDLKFKDLLEKYKKRELNICDFWKDYDSAGGGHQNNCASSR